MDFFEEMEARIPKGEARTRFAPSPTGYMHVGNLRTALYTWLIARHFGGKFILRIEDTDQGRLVDGAVDVIYKTMAECGLTHDEGPDVGGPVGPYVQSERRDLFGKYAKLLCKKGGAYYCFCQKSEEEPADESDSKEIKKHVCACRDLPLAEAEARVAAGAPFVIRQRIPQEGTTTFHDVSFGDITVENKELEDQVLLKSDGLPTYMSSTTISWASHTSYAAASIFPLRPSTIFSTKPLAGTSRPMSTARPSCAIASTRCPSGMATPATKT